MISIELSGIKKCNDSNFTWTTVRLRFASDRVVGCQFQCSSAFLSPTLMYALIPFENKHKTRILHNGFDYNARNKIVFARDTLPLSCYRRRFSKFTWRPYRYVTMFNNQYKVLPQKIKVACDGFVSLIRITGRSSHNPRWGLSSFCQGCGHGSQKTGSSHQVQSKDVMSWANDDHDDDNIQYFHSYINTCTRIKHSPLYD